MAIEMTKVDHIAVKVARGLAGIGIKVRLEPTERGWLISASVKNHSVGTEISWTVADDQRTVIQCAAAICDQLESKLRSAIEKANSATPS